MTGDPQYWHRKTLIGLLAHPDMETRHLIDRMYDQDGEFRAGIKMIAQALPEFVGIMARQARDNVALREAMMKQMEVAPFQTWFPENENKPPDV